MTMHTSMHSLSVRVVQVEKRCLLSDIVYNCMCNVMFINNDCENLQFLSTVTETQ